MQIVKLVHENWGKAARKERHDGPILRLVHTSTTAAQILRQEAAALFLSDMSVVEGEGTAMITASKAVEAFNDQAFLFFWNDEQITDLNTPIPVDPENEALFVRLFALKGG